MSAYPFLASTARPAVAPARRAMFALLLTAVLIAVAFVLPPSEQAAHAVTVGQRTATVAAADAQQMLALLNNERRAHGRRPLTMAYRLRISAHRHNLRMAAANELSHQLPGEPFFATRITNAGYRWRAAGENIGWSSNESLRGLLYLERAMYNEVPPNNGHRQNILSTAFTQVGIDVLFDAKHHKMWFTQDFAAPR